MGESVFEESGILCDREGGSNKCSPKVNDGVRLDSGDEIRAAGPRRRDLVSSDPLATGVYYGKNYVYAFPDRGWILAGSAPREWGVLRAVVEDSGYQK